MQSPRRFECHVVNIQNTKYNPDLERAENRMICFEHISIVQENTIGIGHKFHNLNRPLSMGMKCFC